MPTSLYNFISSTPLSAVLKAKGVNPHQQRILQLSHTLTIGEALHAMSLYSVLSAPIVISPDLESINEEDSSFQCLAGWVSLGDICRGLISDPHIKAHEHGSMLSLMSALEKEGHKYFDRKLITLADSDDKELLFVADAVGASIMDACLMMLGGKENEKVRHRIGIFDSHGEIVGVISQSDIARFLCSNEKMFSSVASKTLSDLGLAKKPSKVTVLFPTMLTLDAIHHLTKEGISGAPVVDEKSGSPIAHFSLSDLRGIKREHLGVLALPLAEFIALASGTSFLGYCQRSPSHHCLSSPFPTEPNQIINVTATRSNSLSTLLKLFTDHKIHRIPLVVDEGGKIKIESILSLTDLLRFATKV